MAKQQQPTSEPTSAPAPTAPNGDGTYTLTITYTVKGGVVQTANKAGGVYTTLAAAKAAGGANDKQELRPSVLGGVTFYSWAKNTINNSERVFKALGGKTGSLAKQPSATELQAALAAHLATLPPAERTAYLAQLAAMQQAS